MYVRQLPCCESALSLATYDKLLFIGSLVCRSSAKCLLLAITLKRSGFLDKGYLLFILYFLLLFFGKGCDISASPSSPRCPSYGCSHR